MAFFCYAVLPVTYNTIGFGVRGFRLEQFFLWAVWLGGSVLAGGDVQEAGKYALVGRVAHVCHLWRRHHQARCPQCLDMGKDLEAADVKRS